MHVSVPQRTHSEIRPPAPHAPHATSSSASPGALELAVDVMAEIARPVPFVTQASAKSYAQGLLGNDLGAVFPPPDASRTWHDPTFASLETPVRSALEAHAPGLAPYAASAENTRLEGLTRVRISPVPLTCKPAQLGLVLRTLTNILTARMKPSIAKTRTYVYVSHSAEHDFAALRDRVRAATTKPKGAILQALQEPLAARREDLARHDLDVAIVGVPGLEHPTYIAATFAGIEHDGARVPEMLALCKLSHTASDAELRHLDAFAEHAFHGTDLS